MSVYASMSKEMLQQEYQVQKALYEKCKAQQLSLNMARGKPSKQQLDIVSDLLQAVTSLWKDSESLWMPVTVQAASMLIKS